MESISGAFRGRTAASFFQCCFDPVQSFLNFVQSTFAIDFIELNLNKKQNALPQQPNTPPAHTKSEAADTPKAAVNE